MKRSAPEELPLLRVLVLEEGVRGRPHWVPCRIGPNIGFSTAKLETYCCVPWQPVVFDMLLLAGAVEFCDRIRKRPALGWGRDFELSVPVHEPERWNSPQVTSALTEALNLLTGDRWSIAFVARERKVEAPAQQRFEIPDGSLSTIPFSDGLDSRLVGNLEARKLGRRLIRVRLGSKRRDRPQSNGKKEPFTSVPYHVGAGDRRFVESTARSRGFKFSLVSAIAAHLVGAERVVVPESGQGALGPALVVVGQAYEDYRSHPLFTYRMEKFLNALLGSDIRFHFPRLWHTKAETLQEFVAADPSAAWADTWSCWQQARQVSVAGRQRQCGICAACMLRRMSVHAAGLVEAKESYAWENLASSSFETAAAAEFSKVTASQREYAIAGTLHLDHLAALASSSTHAQTIRRAAFQLGTVLKRKPVDVEKDLRQVLNKHHKEWSGFMRDVGSGSFLAEWAMVSHEHAA